MISGRLKLRKKLARFLFRNCLIRSSLSKQSQLSNETLILHLCHSQLLLQEVSGMSMQRKKSLIKSRYTKVAFWRIQFWKTLMNHLQKIKLLLVKKVRSQITQWQILKSDLELKKNPQKRTIGQQQILQHQTLTSLFQDFQLVRKSLL